MARGEAQQKILAAARELMLSRGYSATSIDEICSRAGVSKGSLYHVFATKEELGLAVLNAFYHDGVDRVRRGAYATIADPTQRLFGFLDHLVSSAPAFWEHGCLMGNFATELGETSPKIARRVDQVFTELAAGIAPLFAPVAADAADSMALAEQLLMVIEGSIVIGRAHHDPGRIAAGIRRFQQSLRLQAAQPGAAVAE
jgi:TetR/AcrR family transcriptional regulator, transcriptional repressor for nem operon